MKKLFTLTTAFAAALTLVACGTSSNSQSVVGEWGDTSATDTPSLVFTEEGSVSGTDGCNRLMGSYKVDGNEITFEELVSTMMFCEGVDDWLNQAKTASFEDSSMSIFNAEGTQIGVLNRG